VKERFVPMRIGIAEHLLRGDISAFESGIYVIVQIQADYSTGIWRDSAPHVLNSAPEGAELREIQGALTHLTEPKRLAKTVEIGTSFKPARHVHARQMICHRPISASLAVVPRSHRERELVLLEELAAFGASLQTFANAYEESVWACVHHD
jgi:hypothetical protein